MMNYEHQEILWKILRSVRTFVIQSSERKMNLAHNGFSKTVFGEMPGKGRQGAGLSRDLKFRRVGV